MTLESLKFKDIISVYSGIDGRCCCGCSGKHYYASDKVKQGTERRGYEVTPDEVSDRMVTKVWNLLRKNIADVEWFDAALGTHASLVVGKRLYIAYVR